MLRIEPGEERSAKKPECESAYFDQESRSIPGAREAFPIFSVLLVVGICTGTSISMDSPMRQNAPIHDETDCAPNPSGATVIPAIVLGAYCANSILTN